MALEGMQRNVPNLLTISGNGRNCGKTTLACSIIQHIAQQTPVIGLKISPHLHELEKESQVLYQKPYCKLVRETLLSRKDSSRFMQEGAEAYYLQTTDERLWYVFTEVLPLYLDKDKPIVAESGGLKKHCSPQLSLEVNRRSEEQQNVAVSFLGNPSFQVPYSAVADRVHWQGGKWFFQ